MSMERKPAKEFELTGKHVLISFFLFFGVIIAVNFTMATFASNSWTGLVVKNSYVASQKFNSELEHAAIQKARGWHSKISYTNGNLSVVLLDNANKSLPLKQIKLTLGRPAFEQEDKNIILNIGQQGEFLAPILLGPGVWDIVISAASDDKQYRRDARILVNETGIGRLI